MKLPITKAVFDERDREMICKPLESGWVVQGPFVKQFEQMFAEYTAAKHAVATTSCTTAMQLCVSAIGLEPGDEVIVPAYTWVATANVVEHLKAKPVFVDVDPLTFNLIPEQVAERISDKTRAIMPVHLFGLAADMDPIMDLARKHNLAVIEDAACGFAAKYKGRHVGTFGDFGCFSFHPRKAITTGEGGMIISNNADKARVCQILRDHGAGKSDMARHEGKQGFLLADYDFCGFNFRMTDIQGALGVAQMQKADEIQEGRVSRALRYNKLLEQYSWLVRPVVSAGCEHAYQSYVCLFHPEQPSWANLERLRAKRDQVMTELEERGVLTRQGTHTVPLLGFYRNKYGYQPEMFQNSWFAENLSIALPLFAKMTDAEQDFVVESLGECFANSL